jgi:hypothetical protein
VLEGATVAGAPALPRMTSSLATNLYYVAYIMAASAENLGTVNVHDKITSYLG